MRPARLAAFLLLPLLLGLVVRPALADAAPPARPPGNGIVPAGQTQVEMLAESVTLDVSTSPGRVEAVFAMFNAGQAAESMDVRFPMENVDGSGDGYGQRPLISGFAAVVDGQAADIASTEEPFQNGPPIAWATFPVTFPPGQVVRIIISYDAPIGKAVNGTDMDQINYILETGAGWAGPIGSAVVALRLPYSAGPENVSSLDEGQAVTPVYVGREARWEWSSFEPTNADNLRIIFIDPAQWRDIVALEGQTGEKPDDPALAFQLAEAYRQAGTEKHGYAANALLYRLARQAVQMGLAYRPQDARLQGEKIVIDTILCASTDKVCYGSQAQSVADAYDAYTEQHPDQQILTPAQDARAALDRLAQFTATPEPGSVEATATPEAAAQPAPTATLEPPTATTAPTRAPDTAQPPQPSATPVQVVEAPQSSSLAPFGLGAAAGAVLTALALTLLRRRK